MEKDITGPLITTESFLEIIISKSAHTSIVLLVLEKHNAYLTNKSTTSQMASNLYVNIKSKRPKVVIQHNFYVLRIFTPVYMFIKMKRTPGNRWTFSLASPQKYLYTLQL